MSCPLVPYKDRLKQNKIKLIIKEVTRVFSRAFIHALFYPNYKHAYDYADWIMSFQNSQYNLSVKDEIINLQHKLKLIDNLFTRLIYEIDQSTLRRGVPQEHVLLVLREQALLHDLFEKMQKGVLDFAVFSDGSPGLFELPLDVLVEDQRCYSADWGPPFI